VLTRRTRAGGTPCTPANSPSHSSTCATLVVLQTHGTDPATLEHVAATYRESGWPVEVEGDAFTAPFSAQSAGSPPWNLYEFVFYTVVGVGTAEPHGATRWRLDRNA
jgi:hypothetical protein